ncbi:hypothetical protein, partial [Escherichia coli]|uniref:hypothetical protein n=1 Tax=Escherichia coli TaxID=562 RepID=UPI003CF94EAB
CSMMYGIVKTGLMRKCRKSKSMLSIACVRKMQRYRVSNDMIKLNKLKEWVDNHWSRLNSTGSTPPPLLISLPIIVIVLSVELTIKLVHALMYYGTLQFITDKIEKRFVPSGGIKERLLFTLKLFCILLLLLIVMRFSM